MAEHPLDTMAEHTFRLAIRDHRCGELLAHLFDGGGVTHDPKTGEMILIPADVIQELSDGHDDEPAQSEVMDLKLVLVGAARDEFIEATVIGTLKALRDIDEPLLRARWRAMAADTPIRDAVSKLVGHNGPEFDVIITTLKEALGAI